MPNKREKLAANSIDPKFFNEVSQFAHFFSAATVYLSFRIVAVHLHKFSWKWTWIIVACGVALAAWKEFWYDKHDENKATRGSDLEDFTFYMLGIGYALILIWVCQ
ncbi:MAG: hypothetical protein WCA38_05285 [Candidatus Acidiferrales bacterium]